MVQLLLFTLWFHCYHIWNSVACFDGLEFINLDPDGVVLTGRHTEKKPGLRKRAKTEN